MKKYAKWIFGIIASPILLIGILILLLYFPPFQNWAVRQVAEYASAEMGMDISVEHVCLKFPLDLGIEGVKAIQPNDTVPGQRDTVADIKSVVADVQLLPLFKGMVHIDQLTLESAKINTTNLIADTRVKGTIGLLDLKSHGIDLGADTLHLDEALLRDALVDVALSDTAQEDTTKSENFWKIRVAHLNVERTDVTLHMPGDSLQIGTYLGKSEVESGFFDLGKALYDVQRFDWTQGRLTYDNHFVKPVSGLDFNHIALSDITVGVDSLHYLSPDLRLKLRTLSFKEKSGLAVDQLAGAISLDSTRLELPSLSLRTPGSQLHVQLGMDLNAFSDSLPGVMSATVHGHVGRQDLMLFMGDMPEAFRRKWPHQPLIVDGTVRGNLQKMHLRYVRVKLPTAFDIHADGFLGHVTDPKHLQANVELQARTERLDFVTALLDPSFRKTINLPQGISVNGRVRADGPRYDANLLARQGGGSLKAIVHFDAARMAYQADLDARTLPLQNFLPNMGLSPFSGTIALRGAGTDIMSPRTHVQAKAHITRFSYGCYTLDGLTADASLLNGHAQADVHSESPLLAGDISLRAFNRNRHMLGTLSFDLSKIDLKSLGVTDTELRLGACMYADFETDFKQYYRVQGSLDDVTLNHAGHQVRPEGVYFDILSSRDTTHAVVDCGDLHLNVNAQGGYEKILAMGTKVGEELQAQLKKRYIDYARLRERLPLAQISLQSGSENFFMRILNHYGVDFKYVNIDMTSSPLTGLNGLVAIDSLAVDSIPIDTLRLNILSTGDQMTYQAQVRNGWTNPYYTFNALFDGVLMEHGTQLKTRIYDTEDKLGISMGLSADMWPHGVSLHIMDDDAILGYKQFAVNDSNYVFLGDDKRIRANMKLRADDGTGVAIYSNNEDTEALQDITVSLHHFVLDDILAVLPYTPDISGTLNGDYHLLMTQDETSISSSMSVEKMIYEGCPMGDIGTEFTYMPKSDGSHYVDGILMQNGNEVATITGNYRSEGHGYLDATLGMERLPLALVNGFIPERLFGLRGFGEGELKVQGALTKPVVNGELFLDSAYIFSEPYGVTLRFDNDPVTFTNSRLLFENFNLYANNDQPLTVSGYYDFSDLDRMTMDLRMMARNYQIIDARETRRSEVFGKAFINFFGRMQGPVESLSMRGKLDVLGSTDMTYILRDSPLTTDNQLDELVQFTNFNDTTRQKVERPSLSGFNMDLTFSIDHAAHIMCALNADKSNYVDLDGGGDLRMRYDVSSGLRVNGRYTLSNGEMKYSLPVIPLKTFTVQDGSYIEFTGDVMNPRLNITATEHTKAMVTNEGESNGRSVDFDCGVVITKTLNDMGLEFIISAPQDMTVTNQLATMSKEERGKLAVTMLTTGMYLADGNTSAFSVNSAMSAFLQNQINGIAGNALRTLDLSFGMDNSTDAAGNSSTDYSFKFAKRLWNNRLRIIVGGKVSTGSEVSNQNENFFNNVQFEYRLNQNATQYLNLFYERDSYDWLEGMVGEYGGGFIWRRKLSHFQDLFRLKEPAVTMPVPRDSSKVKP